MQGSPGPLFPGSRTPTGGPQKRSGVRRDSIRDPPGKFPRPLPKSKAKPIRLLFVGGFRKRVRLAGSLCLPSEAEDQKNSLRRGRQSFSRYAQLAAPPVLRCFWGRGARVGFQSGGSRCFQTRSRHGPGRDALLPLWNPPPPPPRPSQNGQGTGKELLWPSGRAYPALTLAPRRGECPSSSVGSRGIRHKNVTAFFGAPNEQKGSNSAGLRTWKRARRRGCPGESSKWIGERKPDARADAAGRLDPREITAPGRPLIFSLVAASGRWAAEIRL